MLNISDDVTCQSHRQKFLLHDKIGNKILKFQTALELSPCALQLLSNFSNMSQYCPYFNTVLRAYLIVLGQLFRWYRPSLVEFVIFLWKFEFLKWFHMGKIHLPKFQQSSNDLEREWPEHVLEVTSVDLHCDLLHFDWCFLKSFGGFKIKLMKIFPWNNGDFGSFEIILWWLGSKFEKSQKIAKFLFVWT